MEDGPLKQASEKLADKLPARKTIRDWENRFELAYQRCKHENLTLAGGRRIGFGQALHNAVQATPNP